MGWTAEWKGKYFLMKPPAGYGGVNFKVYVPRSQLFKTDFTLHSTWHSSVTVNMGYKSAIEAMFDNAGKNISGSGIGIFQSNLSYLGGLTHNANLKGQTIYGSIDVDVYFALSFDGLTAPERKKFFGNSKADLFNVEWLGKSDWRGRSFGVHMYDSWSENDGILRINGEGILEKALIYKQGYSSIYKNSVLDDATAMKWALGSVFLHESLHLRYGEHNYKIIKNGTLSAISNYLLIDDSIYKNQMIADYYAGRIVGERDRYGSFTGKWYDSSNSSLVEYLEKAAFEDARVVKSAIYGNNMPSYYQEEQYRKNERQMSYNDLKITISEQSTLAAKMEIYGNIGRSLGSAIASQIKTDNEWERVGVDTVLGAVGLNLGEYIAATTYLPTTSQLKDITTASQEAFGNWGADIAQAFKDAVVGSISSYLTIELSKSLGLNEFEATVAGSAINYVITNIKVLGVTQGTTLNGIKISYEGSALSLASAVAGSIGSYFGTKLGAKVIQPSNQVSAVLTSLASSYGALNGARIGATIGTYLGGPIGGFIGAIIGATIGSFLNWVQTAFIFNLFGRRKQRIPQAYADISLSVGRFELGASDVSGGGNLELAQYMSNIAKETLNGLVDTVAQGQKQKQPWASNLGASFGHSNNQIWVKLGGASGSQTNVNGADEAVDKMVLWALPSLNIRGGNLFLKRAVKRTKAESVAVLSGDLQIAEDYGFYLQNRAVIDAAIALN